MQLDRVAPSVPVPTGGSSSWTNAAPVTDHAGGSTDARAGSTRDPYQYRTSTNNGRPGRRRSNGSSVDISAEGTTQVQFRAVDAIGNISAWSVATLPAATVKIDLVDPTMPTVSGGSSSWTTAASVTITASGSTDTNGSGVAGYEYELSRPTHGGGWPAPPTPGSAAVISTQGLTLVRFRAIDQAGNVSAWGPTDTTSASEAAIDNVAPLKPTVTPTARLPRTYEHRERLRRRRHRRQRRLVLQLQDQPGSGYGAVKKTPTQVGNVDMTASGTIMFQAVDFVGLASRGQIPPPSASADRLYLSGAGRAAAGGGGNRAEALGALADRDLVLGGLGVARGDGIHRLDDEEEHRGRDAQEGDQRVQEVAVPKHAVVDRERQPAEVGLPKIAATIGVIDVGDKGRNQQSEGGADDDRNRQVDQVSAEQKLRSNHSSSPYPPSTSS